MKICFSVLLALSTTMGPCALLIATSASAEQEASHFTLTYRAPPECPSQDEFEEEVRSLLSRGRPTAVRAQAGVQIRSQPNSGYRVSLSVGGGERVIEGRECHDVARAAAVSLALYLESPRSDPGDPPVEGPENAEPSDEPGAPEAAEKSEVLPPTGAFLRGVGGVDTHTLPRVAALAGLGGGYLHRRFLLGVDLLLSPRQTIEIDPARTLESSAATSRLWGCYRVSPSRGVSLGPCLGLSGGFLRFEGRQLAEPRTRSVGYLNTFVGGALWFFAGRHLAFSLEAGWSQPLLPAVVTLEGPGPEVRAHEAGAALRALGGLVWVP